MREGQFRDALCLLFKDFPSKWFFDGLIMFAKTLKKLAQIFFSFLFCPKKSHSPDKALL